MSKGLSSIACTLGLVSCFGGRAALTLDTWATPPNSQFANALTNSLLTLTGTNIRPTTPNSWFYDFIGFRPKVPLDLERVRFLQGKSITSDPSENQNTAKRSLEDVALRVEVTARGTSERIADFNRHAKEKALLSQRLVNISQKNEAERQTTSDPIMKKELETMLKYNTARAKLLLKQSEMLKREAKRLENDVESGNVGPHSSPAQLPYCDIVKIGPLQFLPSPDALRNRIDLPSIGQITGTALILHYKGAPKQTYFWEGIQLPIMPTGGAPGCFAFLYRGSDQVLCAASSTARDSWMNAFTEATICNQMGIQGQLPSAQHVEKELENEEKKDTKKPKEKNPGLTSVKIGMGEKFPFVDINGHKQFMTKQGLVDATKASGSQEDKTNLQKEADKAIEHMDESGAPGIAPHEDETNVIE